MRHQEPEQVHYHRGGPAGSVDRRTAASDSCQLGQRQPQGTACLLLPAAHLCQRGVNTGRTLLLKRASAGKSPQHWLCWRGGQALPDTRRQRKEQGKSEETRMLQRNLEAPRDRRRRGLKTGRLALHSLFAYSLCLQSHCHKSQVSSDVGRFPLPKVKGRRILVPKAATKWQAHPDVTPTSSTTAHWIKGMPLLVGPQSNFKKP